MRHIVAAAMLAQTLMHSACNSGETGVFRGVYTGGFEVSDFRACGTDTTWWATGELRRLGGGQPVGVYAEVQGELSPPGSYGHLGMYPRQIEIRKVRRVEPTPPLFCR